MSPQVATQQHVAEQICRLASAIHEIEIRIASATHDVARAHNLRSEAEQELRAMQHKLASLIAALHPGRGFAKILTETLKEKLP